MTLLQNRTALITGAARGIGRAVAKAFSEAGARLILADLEAPDTDGFHAARAIALDVTDGAATTNVFSELERDGWLPDIVVPNAGILHLADITNMEEAQFTAIIDVNLHGAFLTAREAARCLPAGSVIIFTSSLFGVQASAENAAYSASKFGVTGLMKAMAADLALRGIRVNAVAPGQIQTEMIEKLVAARRAEGKSDPRDRLITRIPMGRLGQPEEVAGAFVWLASDLATYVTGQTIVVDGGWQVG